MFAPYSYSKPSANSELHQLSINFNHDVPRDIFGAHFHDFCARKTIPDLEICGTENQNKTSLNLNVEVEKKLRKFHFTKKSLKSE